MRRFLEPGRYWGFEHFRPLQMPQLGGPAIDAGRNERESGGKFRVPIALDDLCGKFRRLQPELLANVPLDPWVEVRMRANGPAQFANADTSECLQETFFGSGEFVEHERELQSESDRLGVNAMAPADHRRHFVTPRLVGHNAPQFADVLEQDLACLDELHC